MDLLQIAQKRGGVFPANSRTVSLSQSRLADVFVGATWQVAPTERDNLRGFLSRSYLSNHAI